MTEKVQIKLFRRAVPIILLLSILVFSASIIMYALGEEVDIGTRKVWVKPGGSEYESITLEIKEEIFNKLPQGEPPFGGFSLSADTIGKPTFIHHRVYDAKASKLKSGFISKCQLFIYVEIVVENNTREDTYAYDVVYNLQNGLLMIKGRYHVDVRMEKPQWVAEYEKGMQSLTFVVSTTFSSVIFIGIPLFVLIRKIRRPSYERRKLSRGRAILGGAVALLAAYVIIEGIVTATPGAFERFFEGFVYWLITCVGLVLISIVILKP